MSVPVATMKEAEKEALIPSAGTTEGIISSTYARLQRATRGNLLLLTTCVVLIIAAGVLLFPQKMWNRLMLQLFGCVKLKFNGHTFNMCQEIEQQQPVQLF